MQQAIADRYQPEEPFGDEHAFYRKRYIGPSEEPEDLLDDDTGYGSDEAEWYEELFTDIAAGHYLLTSSAIFLMGTSSAVDGVSNGDYGKIAIGGFMTAAGAKFLHAGIPHARDLYERVRDLV